MQVNPVNKSKKSRLVCRGNSRLGTDRCVAVVVRSCELPVARYADISFRIVFGVSNACQS